MPEQTHEHDSGCDVRNTQRLGKHSCRKGPCYCRCSQLDMLHMCSSQASGMPGGSRVRAP